MPNIQISIYISDDEFPRYLKKKEELHEAARDKFKQELAKVK
jgi:hypothetical protein